MLENVRSQQPVHAYSNQETSIAASRKRSKETSSKLHSAILPETPSEQLYSLQNEINSLSMRSPVTGHSTTGYGAEQPQSLSNLVHVSNLLKEKQELIDRSRAAPNRLGIGRGKARPESELRTRKYNILAPPPPTYRAPKRQELLPQQQSASLGHPIITATPSPHDIYGPTIGVDVRVSRDHGPRQVSAQEQRFGCPVDLRTVSYSKSLPYKEKNPRRQIPGVTGSIAVAQFPAICMGADLPRFESDGPSPTASSVPTEASQMNSSVLVAQCMTSPTKYDHLQPQNEHLSATLNVTAGAPFATDFSLSQSPAREIPIKDNIITGEYVSPDPSLNQYRRPLPSGSAFQLSEFQLEHSFERQQDWPKPSGGTTHDSLEAQARARKPIIVREQDDVAELQRLAIKSGKTNPHIFSPNGTAPLLNISNIPDGSFPNTPHGSTMNSFSSTMSGMTPHSFSASSKLDPILFDRPAVEKPRPLQPSQDQLLAREQERAQEESEKAQRIARITERERERERERKATEAEPWRQDHIIVDSVHVNDSDVHARPLSPSFQLSSNLNVLRNLVDESKHSPARRTQPILSPSLTQPTNDHERAKPFLIDEPEDSIYSGVYDTQPTPIIRQKAPVRKLKSKAKRVAPKSKIPFHETIKDWN